MFNKYPSTELLPLGMFFGICLFIVTLNGCPAPNDANAQSAPQVRPVDWELIQAPHGSDNASRTQVPGGWIVYVNGFSRPSTTFVPDPDHKWLAPEAEAESDPSAETLKRYVAADRANYEVMKRLFKDVQNDDLITIMDAWERRLQAVEGK